MIYLVKRVPNADTHNRICFAKNSCFSTADRLNFNNVALYTKCNLYTLHIALFRMNTTVQLVKFVVLTKVNAILLKQIAIIYHIEAR